MKVSVSLALIVLVGLLASSNALPARKRMAYYQRNAYYSSPQRMMYVQYVQPGATHARSTQGASALVAGDAVATGTYLEGADVGTAGATKVHIGADGSYGYVASAEQTGEDVLGAAGAHGAHSVAEAYPDENVPQQVEIEIEGGALPAAPGSPGAPGAPAAIDTVSYQGATYEGDAAVLSAASGAPAQPAVTSAADEVVKTDDEAKVPRDYHFDTAEAVAPLLPVAPAVDVASDLPAPAPIAPVATPARRYLPAKKMVYVELEHSAESDLAEDNETEQAVAVAQDSEQEEEEEDDTDVAPVVPVAPKYPARAPAARRPVAKKPVKPSKATPDCAGCAKAAAKPKPLPAGTFFPIDFGGTSGGAIAIANSFSTGEGGSATSHAIAYGSPEAARARVRPSKIH